jgi:hypothetical protein
MKTRSLFLAGALALATFSIANAKSYSVTIDSPSQAGTTMLAAGQYRLKVEGSNAVFTNVQTSKSFTSPVKIETASRKHDTTAVESRDQNGTRHIQAIELGGSTETLEFSD